MFFMIRCNFLLNICSKFFVMILKIMATLKIRSTLPCLVACPMRAIRTGPKCPMALSNTLDTNQLVGQKLLLPDNSTTLHYLISINLLKMSEHTRGILLGCTICSKVLSAKQSFQRCLGSSSHSYKGCTLHPYWHQ